MSKRVHNEIKGTVSGTVVQAHTINAISITGQTITGQTGAQTTESPTVKQTGKGPRVIEGDNPDGIRHHF
ncbi:hypothetical protein ACFYYD_04140 [Streptomyces bluensis]|uniref:hypothetical protein n=1 Tax=Streptomyces bluensis TaxID=33897 RepID=UPI0036A2F4C3